MVKEGFDICDNRPTKTNNQTKGIKRMLTKPMEVMNHFNKVSHTSRKEVYQAMQKQYMAGAVPNGLFSNSEIVLACDPFLQACKRTGLLKNGYGSTPDEQAELDAARNLEFGTRLFGTWRNTASIYRIDPSVAGQALDALIPDETPSDIYTNLPEWAVYMEMPSESDLKVETMKTVLRNGVNVNEPIRKRIVGFWAMHDTIQMEGESSKNCLDIFCNLEYEDDVRLNEMVLVPIRLLLDENLTIIESFKAGYGDEEGMFDSLPIRQMLSLLLWLCVEEPDVTDIKNKKVDRQELKKPRYGKNKKTQAFIPPQQECYFDIARRMGGEVREWDKVVEHAQSLGLPKRKCPHIRRGHWTGVWVGSGDNKKYKPYWQKPLFINAK